MNTNNDQSFIPDENLLQDLAKRLFRENSYQTSADPVAGQYAPVNESFTDPRIERIPFS
jgi:hypothetical protein